MNNQNTRTNLYLREATCRVLQELSHIRSIMMETTFSFLTTVGQAEYARAYAAFPSDVHEFHTIYGQTGSGANITNWLVPGPFPIQDIREQWNAGYQAPHPSMWAWHHSKLCFAPIPSQVVTIKGDYLQDATRDSTTGITMLPTDTTSSNPWFNRGEQTLMNGVLKDYFLAIAKDPVAAAMCAEQYEDAKVTLRKDWIMLKFPSGQSDFNF